jgi:hypothetical protein
MSLSFHDSRRFRIVPLKAFKKAKFGQVQEGVHKSLGFASAPSLDLNASISQDDLIVSEDDWIASEDDWIASEDHPSVLV